MKVYLGADHRGFDLKEKLLGWLSQNYPIEDLGAKILEDNDDFVQYAADVAKNVSQNLDSRGIVICGSGAGVEIASNKIKGARCSLGQSELQITKAREADDINILAIASDFTDFDKAKEFIQIFLNTPFVANENHKRRIEEIKELE